MRAIDTNVLVRLITRDDTAQAAAAEAFVEPGAWVPTVVLVEAMWTLAAVYDRTPSELANTIERLLDHRALVLEDADTVDAALKLFRGRPSLAFSDCLILAAARKSGHVPLGTFDRTLAKIDGAQKI